MDRTTIVNVPPEQMCELCLYRFIIMCAPPSVLHMYRNIEKVSKQALLNKTDGLSTANHGTIEQGARGRDQSGPPSQLFTS